MSAILHAFKAHKVAKMRTQGREHAYEAVLSGAESIAHLSTREYRDGCRAAASCLRHSLQSAAIGWLVSLAERVEVGEPATSYTTTIDFHGPVVTHQEREN